MANLTISSEVSYVDSAVDLRVVQVGEAFTKVMPAYVDGTTGKAMKAVATSEDAANAQMIVVSAASTDGWVAAVFPGSRISFGTILTKGGIYIVSATAGLIANQGDLSTNQWQRVLGQAEASDVFHFNPQPVVQVP